MTKTAAPTLDGVLASINKDYGPGATMQLSARPLEIPVISTGSVGLDQALGIGGFPRGRITEIFGPQSAGKTTAAIHAIANAQRAGGVAAFVDAENALSPSWVNSCGGDASSLIVAQPGSGEEGLDIAERLIRSQLVDVVVVDSVAALVPQAEIDATMGDSTGMALLARMMGQGMRKINSALTGNQRTVVIFINQLREKPGVAFGSPEYQPGGKALPFYASVRLDVRAIERLKDPTGNPYGNRLRVKVVKNKCAPPFLQAEFELWFGTGINHQGELIELGNKYGIVLKNGNFYGFNGATLGNGMRNACAYLWEHTEVADQIEGALRAAMGSPGEHQSIVPMPQVQLPETGLVPAEV